MKKKIKILLQIFLFAIILLMCNEIKAASVTLAPSKSRIDVGDQFTISMNLSQARVASLNAKITVDTTKIQYISSSKPNNTNFSNGRILYTWTDASGGANPLTDGTIVTFTLKAIASGTASFGLSGSFYDPDENKVNMALNGTSVVINEEEPETPPITPEEPEPETPTEPTNPGTQTTPENTVTPPTQIPENPETQTPPENNENVGNNQGETGNNQETVQPPNENNQQVEQNNDLSSNANLSSLQVNVEGISPKFYKNTTQYYLIIDNTINEINVTAVPEDNRAKVDIQGNTNLQIGTNTITINVTAQDGTKKAYYINITKTDDPNNANTNLENLAIENVTLNPEFNVNVLEYSVNIASNIESLNILAVPQIEGATVKITGGDKLSFGNNIITIAVTAKDGVSLKNYTINAYRLTETEEIEEQNRLLLEQNNINENINNNTIREQNLNDKNEENNIGLWIIFWLLIIVIIGIVIYLIWRNKNKRV